MRYGEGLLEEIRRRTDLVALVGRRVKLVRKGRVMWGCCPFHGEKSPSFKVENDPKYAYKCFGCGKSGDAFRWTMEIENLTFDKAVEKLAEEAGVELNEQDLKGPDLGSTLGRPVFISYCHADEELKDELLTHLSGLRRENLISVWHDRMLIPGEHLDESIERQLAESDVILLLISASFINSDYCAEREMIRAFERHYQGKAQVITIVLRHCQWMNVPIKPRGKLGDFVALPKDAKPVNSYEDRDVAWNQVVAELRRFLSDASHLKISRLPTASNDVALISKHLKGPVSEKRALRPFHQSLLSVVQEAEAATAGRFFEGLAAGLRDLDGILGGFRKSDLILVAGRPEMGSTSLVLSIISNTLCARRDVIALKGEEGAPLPAIAMFSFDMSSEQVARRMLSANTAIPLWKISSGKLTESEWERFVLAMQEYSSVPLLVAEGPMSVDQLCTEAARIQKEANLKCIVVDGLQRLAAWSGENGEAANCDRIVHRLKMLASELGLPVIVTSSLSRSVDGRESPEPKLADLSESGAIERFSDVILLLYREFQHLKEVEPNSGIADHARWIERAERAYGKAEIFISKNRNGTTARVGLDFDETTGVFQDFSAISATDVREVGGR